MVLLTTSKRSLPGRWWFGLLVKLYKSKVHFKSNHLIRYNTVHQSLLVLTFCLCSLTSNLKPLYLHACTYSCSKIPIETQLGFVHHTQGLGRIKLTRYGDLRYSSPVQAEGKILERKLKSFPRLVIWSTCINSLWTEILAVEGLNARLLAIH